jgi:integrase
MRIGELFSLQADSVHDTYCIGGLKTEAGRNRIIPIPEQVKSYFDYFKDRAGDAELLITGYDGNRDIHNFRNRDYYGMLDALGIERKSPHSARHTYASRAVQAGMPPEMLQKILGHADYSTTANIYVHTDIDALVQAAKLINDKKEKKSKKPKS